jgi:hypothetical protein
MTDQAPIPAADPKAAAVYIADLAGGLALLARRNGLNTLGYLLDMAKLEAETIKGMDGQARGPT